MTFIESAVLGVVQGLTEFLPVSSSAHLVLVPALLKWDEPTVMFIVALHLGTLMACLLYFRQDVKRLVLSFFTSLRKMTNSSMLTPPEKLVWLIAASTLPTAFFGFVFKDYFEHLFENVRGVSVFLFVTALLLFVSERLKRETKELGQLSFLEAFLIGLGQTVSIAPGISRSGACFSSAVLLGYNKTDAARYAFLLSLPSVTGAVVLKGADALKGVSAETSLFFLSVGILASFLSGMLAIDFFIKKVSTLSLSYFSAYCLILGATSLFMFFR